MNKKEEKLEPKEWKNDELCPCGSGKKYKNCCKKKDLKYYYKDAKEYITSMYIDKELKKVIINIKKQFKEIFGRDICDDEFLIAGGMKNKLNLFIRKMKFSGEIPIDCLYAYDRTGIMLTSFNSNKISDVDINEFEKAKEEYNKLINKDLSDNEINELQFIEDTNNYIKVIFENSIIGMEFVLSKYIKDLTNLIEVPDGFYIKCLQDLMIYSAYRTCQHLETLSKLVDEGYYESALATVRMLFEILVNIRVFRNNKQLFDEKILSLTKLEEGEYERKSKFIVVDKKTGKEYYCKVKIDRFSNIAREKFEALYETLYDELSGFIHLDTLTAKKIFEKKDNFLDLDEAYLAGIIAMILITGIIVELSEYEKNPERTKRDLKYYANKRIKELTAALEIIKIIDEKNIYNLLLDMLNDYEKLCKIN